MKEVAKGNAYFSPSILKRLLELYRGANVQGRNVRRQNEHLTSREQEVLQIDVYKRQTRSLGILDRIVAGLGDAKFIGEKLLFGHPLLGEELADCDRDLAGRSQGGRKRKP